MNTHPFRIPPGADLRKALEECLAAQGQAAGFVLSGIGSLTHASLRYAGRQDEASISGPLEIIGLSGSLSPDGAHLHMSISTESGQVLGGHVGYGNTVRTTAEVLVAFLPEWRFSRAHDPDVGYRELVVRRNERSQTVAVAGPHEEPMQLDTQRIDEAVLALLYLGLHEGDRAWKSFDWDAMARLHEKGLISDPVGKAKSVVLTQEGLREAEPMLCRLFGKKRT